MTNYDVEKTHNDEDDVQALLLELREISDRRSNILHESINKKNDSDGKTFSSFNMLEEEEKDAANDFLLRTPESSIFNQYWYSRNTINSLCYSIQEGLDQLEGGKNIAFLSTPSLYFAFPTKTSKNCKLFDVSIQRWMRPKIFEFFNHFNNENTFT